MANKQRSEYNRRLFLKTLTAGGLCLAALPARETLAGFDPCWTGATNHMTTTPIALSLFEIFKIGPGPSSSHTIGPMRAANNFIKLAATLPPDKLAQATDLKVHLYGSLSATGKGHGTDRALMAGLMGQTPEKCPAAILDNLFKDPAASYTVDIAGRKIAVTAKDIVFDRLEHDFPYSNTLVLSLNGPGGELVSREYYSVGGGFIEWKGWTPPERGVPVHRYDSMNGLLALMKDGNLSMSQVMLANEKAVTGATDQAIREGLEMVLEAMNESVAAGLKVEGVLPGPYGVERKAKALLAGSKRIKPGEDIFVTRLSAYAYAAAEENAAGHRIVTAPTAGSAGVMPAVVHMLMTDRKATAKSLRDGLLTAAAVGMLAKTNASIAGADVGCQGEIGVASSMAAAMLAAVAGKSPVVVESSAELALEHHLGMTCDPVGGYVQVPCISRCAMGAVKSYAACLMASAAGNTRNPVGLDVAIRTMAATGKDMPSKYKETSQGGLAVFMTGC